MNLYKSLAFILLFTVVLNFSNAQNSIISNVYNRSTVSLSGDWKYIVDPYENGYYNYRYEAFDQSENPSANAFFLNSKPQSPSDLIEYDFDKSETIQVPGDWNSQKENLFYYEGTVWYKKSFDFQKKSAENRVFVYFGASNYDTEVYVNGKKVGRHLGGFTPFNFEITSLLQEKGNFLIVKVDNKRKKEGVPTLNTDWWNYGGITRDVQIVETAPTFINDFKIQLDQNNATMIKGFVQLNGTAKSGQKVSLEIPELKIKKEFVADVNGRCVLDFPVKNVSYWSNTNPKLYDVSLSSGSDLVKDQIGFRTIKTEGSEILLNGKKMFLKGICIHEENPIEGRRANSMEDAKLLLNWAKELGCNYVRLAHYAHNENMVRLADQMGIMVWEESPVYWTIQWQNPDTYKNAENQLTELITRDKNRASVIIWSMANETPQSAPRTLFLTNLAKKARELDGTRLISAALEQSADPNNEFVMTIDDEFEKEVDVLSFNQYVGWYNGLPEKCQKIEWKITQNKPVLISEFGAGSKYGLHGDKSERWTEEFQEELYIETLKMLDKIDQLRGFTPWILVDFRSPRRALPEIQDGWNRKGLLSDKGEKKKAYYILQKYYSTK